MFDRQTKYPVGPLAPVPIWGGGGGGQGPPGPPGPTGPQGPAAPVQAGTLEAAARLKGDGTIQTQSGFTKISRVSAGIYEFLLVTPFPEEQAVMLVTLRNLFDPKPMMLFTTASMGAGNTTVRVALYDTGGKAQDADFSLAVFRVINVKI